MRRRLSLLVLAIVLITSACSSTLSNPNIAIPTDVVLTYPPTTVMTWEDFLQSQWDSYDSHLQAMHCLAWLDDAGEAYYIFGFIHDMQELGHSDEEAAHAWRIMAGILRRECKPFIVLSSP